MGFIIKWLEDGTKLLGSIDEYVPVDQSSFDSFESILDVGEDAVDFVETQGIFGFLFRLSSLARTKKQRTEQQC